jgi:hypothetical protein
VLRLASYWEMSWQILYAKNSLGCCWNDCDLDVLVQCAFTATLQVPFGWNQPQGCHMTKVLAVCGMIPHIPMHDAKLRLCGATWGLATCSIMTPLMSMLSLDSNKNTWVGVKTAICGER